MESKQKSETGKNTTIKDFESLKVLGTGTYGKVMLVRHKISRKLYAMKVLKISVIREKN
jgi:serine/threonine protein kinase